MDAIEEILKGVSPELQRLARKARSLILQIMPTAVEVVWPNQSIASYGVGQKKMSEHFCYIGIHKDHVNLGFYYGADLPDPNELLEGSGKALRHFKLHRSEQLETPGLRRLIEVATNHLPRLKKG